MANLRNAISRFIEECKNMKELKKIHSQIITSPFLLQSDKFLLLSRLLFFCAISDFGSLGYATVVFRSMKNPNLYVYNVMIRAYASKINGFGNEIRSSQSLLLHKQMLSEGIAPNCLTFPFLVKECTTRFHGRTGRSIHAQVIKYGFYNDVFVQNSLIALYSACGTLSSARKLFDEMTATRDLVSWNSMIIGHLRSGELDEALDLFRKMSTGNIVTWNSIITGFVQGGRPREALAFFRELQLVSSDMVRPDKITIASVLSACASLGAIDHGKWVHSYLKMSGQESDMVIGTALIDMYGKCGCVEKAYEVFKEMQKKDTLAWTAMISVFALHGFSKEALNLYEEMEKEGVRPNHVTFVGLLSACAHSGLVAEGRCCFVAMKQVHLIEPEVYHYAGMVDILSRAALFEEAELLIRSMPMKPDAFVWGALLGGCQMHANVELGERVAQYLVDLEPLNHAFYVSVCDMYAKSGRFEDVKRIRTLLKERGIKKEVPGCSMIEIDGVVHEFSVRGSPYVQMDKIIGVLKDINDDMKMGRYLFGYNVSYDI